MNYVVDFLLLCLIVVAIVTSVERGFTGLGFFGVIKTILSLGVGGLACYGIILLMNLMGWSTAMYNWYVDLIKADAASSYMAAKVLSYAIPCLITFILVSILTAKILNQLGVLFRNIRRKHPVFRNVDNFFALLLKLVFCAAIVLCVFAVIHSFNMPDFKLTDGNFLFQGANESISAAPVSGIIYRVNPLNGTFLKLAADLKTAFNSLPVPVFAV